MKILLEGWDGTGKTTLADALAARLGWPVRWLGEPPVARPLAWYARSLDRGRHEILDRSWWSIAVYGPLVRGRVELRPEELFYLDLLAWDALLVECVAAPAAVAERIRLAGDGHPAETVLPAAAGMARFEAELRSSRRPPSRRWLVKSDARVNLVRTVDEVAKRALAWPLAAPLRGVGCTRGPAVALVGEDSPYGDPPWHRGGAAAYLLRALLTLPLTTADVYLTNASHPDLAEELWQVQPRRVVPLGLAARARVRACGLICRGLRHPQYWRRFRAGREAEYGARLAELIGL